MSVLNTSQYKQCLMFVYLDTSKLKLIIYRPDLHNLQTRKKVKQQAMGAKKVSVNVKTKNGFKHYHL